MPIIDTTLRDVSFLDIVTENKMAVYKINLLGAQKLYIKFINTR